MDVDEILNNRSFDLRLGFVTKLFLLFLLFGKRWKGCDVTVCWWFLRWVSLFICISFVSFLFGGVLYISNIIFFQ